MITVILISQQAVNNLF